MPLDRALQINYEMGDAVIHGIGAENKDPLGVQIIFREVSRESYRKDNLWRIPIRAHDVVSKLRAAFPKATMSEEIEARVRMAEVQEQGMARAQSFIASTPEKRMAWLMKSGFRLKTPPLADYQVQSIGFGLMMPKCALWPDTGLGKTYIATGIMDILKQRADVKGEEFKALVVAPKTLLSTGWGRDIRKFSTMTTTNISEPEAGERDTRCPFPGCNKVAENGKPIHISHFKKHLEMESRSTFAEGQSHQDRLKELIEEFYKKHPRHKAAGKDSRIEATEAQLHESKSDVFMINPQNVHGDIAKLLMGVKWSIVIVDESSIMRDPESRTTKALLDLGDMVPRAIPMTATPRPNSSTELWAQMAFVDHCLGTSYRVFKNRFFHEERVGPGFTKIWAKDGAEIEISDIISKRSLRFRQRDCLDLPDEIDETIEITMSEQMRDNYREMLEEMSTMVDKQEVSVNVKVAQLMKLAQIGSGFIYNRDQEPLIIEDNPRIDTTVSMTEQLVLAEDRQVVIWVRFSKTEGQIIKKRLEKAGIQVSTMWGGMKDADITKSTEDFESRRSMVMMAQAKSAQFGHTWTSSDAMIFHSYDYSWESYYQCRKRIMRFGQKRPCNYFNIVCKGSVDKQIMKLLQQKSDMSAIVIDRSFMKAVKEQFARSVGDT